MHGLLAGAGHSSNPEWNPSGLGYGADEAAYAGFMDYVVGVHGGAAGYVGRAGKIGYGVYVSYLSSGTLTRTGWDDPVGGAGDTFSHSEIVIGVSEGLRVRPYWALGSGLKLARQALEDETSAGAFLDLSTTLRVYPLDRHDAMGPAVYAAFAVRNLKIARWDDEEGEVPLNSEAGVALRSTGGGLTVGLSSYFGRDGRQEIRTCIAARPSGEFEVRLGYRRRTGAFSDTGNDLPWERGLLAGFGIGFDRFWIDYTFEDASPLDNVHRFGLRAILAPTESN
jgi:hypothetical protein